MKITKSQLKQIIKEELSSVLVNEGIFDFFGGGKKEEPAKELDKSDLTEEDLLVAHFLKMIHADGLIDVEKSLGHKGASSGWYGVDYPGSTQVKIARLRLSDDSAEQALAGNLYQLATKTKRVNRETGEATRRGLDTSEGLGDNLWVLSDWVGSRKRPRPAEKSSVMDKYDFKFDGADSIANTIVDAMNAAHVEYRDEKRQEEKWRKDRKRGFEAGQEAAADRSIERGEVDWHTGKLTDKGKAEYNKRRRS